MKKIFYILILTSLIFAGCSKTPSSKSNKIKVAGLIRTDKETFIVAYTNALKKAAERENVDLSICISNDDAAVQIDQVKTMLNSGIKYFVITAVDSSITEQIAKIIHSQGGAAAFSNILPSDAALDVGKNFFYSSSSEIAAGEFQAQILDEYFKKNPSKLSGKTVNILYLNGEYGHSAQIFRRQGFMNGMEARGYAVNVLGEGGANWNFDSARQIISSFLPEYGSKMNAIICQNDDMALGSLAALDDAKYFSQTDDDGDGTIYKVPVIGVDATDKAKESVQENKLYATVLQDAEGQASTALELVVQIAKTGITRGFVTSNGVKAATEVTGESPLTRASILEQCFMVPFVPITE